MATPLTESTVEEAVLVRCFTVDYNPIISDLLLPKLISGDIRIKDAEKFVGGCT